MIDLRITKENSEAIGFVFASHYAQALSINDVNKWAESILLATTIYPDYILDLCTYKEPLKDFHKIMGFVPAATLSADEFIALHAIADLRGINRYEPDPTKEKAKEALANNLNILKRFEEQFPFVQIKA